MVTYKHVTKVVRNRCVNHEAKRVDSKAILLIIVTSIGALIIWIIKQTQILLIKQTNYEMYMRYTVQYRVHCSIRTTAQSVRTQQRKRTSHESEMVTYKHVTEVVKNRCVNHQAKRVDSRAILLLSATSVGALISWIFIQTSTNIANKTYKLYKWKCTHFIKLQYILDH